MITCLDPETISRLRGQVLVDSPEAAIRQLVENALDADAHHITVKLHLGTLSICVEDDGEGIDEEDLEKAGKPYFTSKSGGGSRTYGYRGEALSAIASCSSSMVISSRRRGAEQWTTKSFGDDDSLNFDVLSDFFEPSFGSNGTVVMVARFLGPLAVRWELARENEGRLLQNVRLLLFECIVGREVGITVYTCDSYNTESKFHIIVGSSAGATVTDKYASFFGKTAFENYSFKGESANVASWVSREPTHTKDQQFVVVNSRPISLPAREKRSISSTLTKAKYDKQKGYFGRSMATYPSYVMLVESKKLEELSLSPDEPSLTKLLADTVMESIATTMKVDTSTAGRPSTPITPKRGTNSSSASRAVTPNRIGTPKSLSASPIMSNSPSMSQVTAEVFLDHCEIINQVALQFILIRGQDSLYIIDQHACDERICYENILQEYIRDLQDPFIDLRVRCVAFEVKVGEIEAEKLKKSRPAFQTFGIDFDASEGSIIVTHLPAILVQRSSERDSLRTFMLGFADLQQNVHPLTGASSDWFQVVSKIPIAIREALISKSCRSAIKFGEALSDSEMDHLIGELAKCRLFTQCAHGRPTIFPLCEIADAIPKSFEEDLVP